MNTVNKVIGHIVTLFLISMFVAAGIKLFGNTYGALFAVAPAWFTTVAPVAYPLGIVAAYILYLRRRDKPPYLGAQLGMSIFVTLVSPFMAGLAILSAEGGPLPERGLNVICGLLLLMATMPPVMAFCSGRDLRRTQPTV